MSMEFSVDDRDWLNIIFEIFQFHFNMKKMDAHQVNVNNVSILVLIKLFGKFSCLVTMLSKFLFRRCHVMATECHGRAEWNSLPGGFAHCFVFLTCNGSDGDNLMVKRTNK